MEKDGEDDKLCPIARSGVGQGAGCVKPVVSNPGETGGHRGEGHGVRPRVREHKNRVFVAHFGVVPQGEHHRDPPVDAQSCHAQHRVRGQESLQEAHDLAEAISPRLSFTDKSYQSERHVGDGEQQVAEGEVEVEQTGDLLADLRVIQKANQHQDVGQQRHYNNHNHQHWENYLRSVHPVDTRNSLLSSFSAHIQSLFCSCKITLITRNRVHASPDLFTGGDSLFFQLHCFFFGKDIQEDSDMIENLCLLVF